MNVYDCKSNLFLTLHKPSPSLQHKDIGTVGYLVDSLVKTHCICYPPEFEGSELEEGLAETVAGIQLWLRFPRVRRLTTYDTTRPDDAGSLHWITGVP